MFKIDVIIENVNHNDLCLHGNVRAVLMHRFMHYIVDVYELLTAVEYRDRRETWENDVVMLGMNYKCRQYST